MRDKGPVCEGHFCGLDESKAGPHLYVFAAAGKWCVDFDGKLGPPIGGERFPHQSVQGGSHSIRGVSSSRLFRTLPFSNSTQNAKHNQLFYLETLPFSFRLDSSLFCAVSAHPRRTYTSLALALVESGRAGCLNSWISNLQKAGLSVRHSMYLPH